MTGRRLAPGPLEGLPGGIPIVGQRPEELEKFFMQKLPDGTQQAFRAVALSYIPAPIFEAMVNAIAQQTAVVVLNQLVAAGIIPPPPPQETENASDDIDAALDANIERGHADADEVPAP